MGIFGRSQPWALELQVKRPQVGRWQKHAERQSVGESVGEGRKSLSLGFQVGLQAVGVSTNPKRFQSFKFACPVVAASRPQSLPAVMLDWETAGNKEKNTA